MAQGYANNTGDHQNYLNFTSWKYPVSLSWPAEIASPSTAAVSGQTSTPSASPTTVSVKQHSLPGQNATKINFTFIDSLRANAAKIATNFGLTNNYSSYPALASIINTNQFASSGTTSAAGTGILDAVLAEGGANIVAPAKSEAFTPEKELSAANELEKIAVYANYSNYQNSGYAQYTVYYTNHNESGATRYSDHNESGYSNHTDTGYNNHNNVNSGDPCWGVAGGYWNCYIASALCYVRTGYSNYSQINTGYNNHTESGAAGHTDTGLVRYSDHVDTGNPNSAYANYIVGYSNYSNNYGNYTKIV